MILLHDRNKKNHPSEDHTLLLQRIAQFSVSKANHSNRISGIFNRSDRARQHPRDPLLLWYQGRPDRGLQQTKPSQVNSTARTSHEDFTNHLLSLACVACLCDCSWWSFFFAVVVLIVTRKNRFLQLIISSQIYLI